MRYLAIYQIFQEIFQEIGNKGFFLTVRNLTGRISMKLFTKDLSWNHCWSWFISKLFANETSLFSVVRDLNTSENEINDNLKKIETWGY